jgi:hypothetical protein
MSQEMLPGGYWLKPVTFDEFMPVARPGAGPQDQHGLVTEFARLADEVAESASQQRKMPAQRARAR